MLEDNAKLLLCGDRHIIVQNIWVVKRHKRSSRNSKRCSKTRIFTLRFTGLFTGVILVTDELSDLFLMIYRLPGEAYWTLKNPLITLNLPRYGMKTDFLRASELWVHVEQIT